MGRIHVKYIQLVILIILIFIGCSTTTKTIKSLELTPPEIPEESNPYDGVKTITTVKYHFVEKFGEFIPIEESKTVSSYNTERTENEVVRYDSLGNVIVGSNGWWKTVFNYDTNGNMIKEFQNSEGKLVEGGSGYSRKIRDYDSSGRLIEESYYDSEGNLKNVLGGISEYFLDDDSVEVYKHSYYDSGRNLVDSYFGYSINISKHWLNEESVEVSKVSYFDSEEKPDTNSIGYHTNITKHFFDKDSVKVSETSYYDIEGKLMTISDSQGGGYCRTVNKFIPFRDSLFSIQTKQYDSKGNLVEGKNRHILIVDGDNYPVESFTVLPNGEIKSLSETRFTSKGKLIKESLSWNRTEKFKSYRDSPYLKYQNGTHLVLIDQRLNTYDKMNRILKSEYSIIEHKFGEFKKNPVLLTVYEYEEY